MSSIGFKEKELHLFKSTYRRREHGDIGGSYYSSKVTKPNRNRKFYYRYL